MLEYLSPRIVELGSLGLKSGRNYTKRLVVVHLIIDNLRHPVRYYFSLLILSFLCTRVHAQIVGFVDSVEVHRTDTIFFAFGSDVLDERARTQVQSLVADRPGELELYLEGHTDAVGSNAANDDLARRRSLNTLAAARSAGWPEASIELRHFGERRLSVQTKGRERLNRRVLLRSGLPRRYARFVGTITDQDGNPLPGAVIAHGQYLEDTARANPDGTYQLFLPLNEALRLDVFAENHFFSSHQLTLSEATPVPPLITQLTPATSGSRMSVPDLYFIGNQTNLLKESFPTLPRLLQFMRSSPEVRIELAGHVNSPGPKKPPGTWEYKLSFDRAKMIYDYLLKFGIDKKRLRFRGYSNYEMVFPKAKFEKQMRANRRVEIRVL